MPTLRFLCVLLFWAATARGVETLAYIPAAAHAAGAAGSLWTTEVALFNPSRTEERQIGILFQPRPGQTAPAEFVVRLGPREAKTLADVVAALGTSGGGALRLRGDGPIVASSRTFNTGSPSCGSFGTGVPAIPESAAVTAGVFPPLRAARINVGLVSVRPGGTARARISLRSENGTTLLREAAVEVPALGSVQLDDVVSGLSAEPVVIEVSADVPVLAWATPIDGTSGDGTFLLATADELEDEGWEARFRIPVAQGLTWRVEDGFRATRTGFTYGVPRVVALPDGHVRLFAPAMDGMRSATSTDGLTFVDDPGTRGRMSDVAVIYLESGGWRFLWSEGTQTSQFLKSAVSTDGLSFTMEPGERMRPGPQDAGLIQVPHAARLADGRWRLYYVADWQGAGGSVNRNNTRTALSTDEGLTWTLDAGSEATGRDTVDPDVVPLVGGGYRLYYKQGDAFRAADSTDGRIFPSSGTAGRQVLDARERYDPTIITFPDGTIRMYFGTPGGIGSAVATDTVLSPPGPETPPAR